MILTTQSPEGTCESHLKRPHDWTNSPLFHTEVNQSDLLLCLDPTDLSGPRLVCESMFLVTCHSVLQCISPPTSWICNHSVYLLKEELLCSQRDWFWTSVDPETTPWSFLQCWPHRCFHIIWSDRIEKALDVPCAQRTNVLDSWSPSQKEVHCALCASFTVKISPCSVETAVTMTIITNLPFRGHCFQLIASFFVWRLLLKPFPWFFRKCLVLAFFLN